MILHTLNSSPFQTLALKNCLDMLTDADQLLLIEDAVIASCAEHDYFLQLQILSQQNRLFVLSDDLIARGIENEIGQKSSYAEFVNLVINNKSHLAW
ncbi:MAG: sulfurtransferase complex subunit TusB [Psychromonas sp.]